MQHIHGDCLLETVVTLFQSITSPKNQLDIVKQVWEGLTACKKAQFIRRYGHITQLMYVQINSLSVESTTSNIGIPLTDASLLTPLA